MIFDIKSNLPKQTRDEIDRVEAIPSAQRTTLESAFLASLVGYLTNEIISRDSEDLILLAAGNTLPTSYTGFKKGALFIKKDASGDGLYNNTGDENSATWSLLKDTDANLVASATPVNAVAAAKVLTVGGLPTEDDTVTLGSQVYTWKDTIGSAVAASGVLTFGANAGNGKLVVIGTRTFTFKTALTEVKAFGTLTATGNAVDSDKVVIGGVTYTFTVNLSGAAYEVKIGLLATDTLDNLIAAINKASGESTTYGTGTLVHPTVSAAAGAGDTVVITAKTIGVAGNSIATTKTSTGLGFGAGTLGSGADAVANEVLISAVNASGSLDNLIAAINHAAGEGTTYSTGTLVHATVSAAVGDGDTMGVTAKTAGDEGNLIATTTDIGSASWANETLIGGEGVEEAYDVLIGESAEVCIDNLVLAITAGSGEGTNYGSGTVEHPTVTAVKTNSSTMTATAKIKGVSGNSIAIDEDGGNTSWAGGAVALSGGVNGTVASAGQLYRDATYLYLAIAANTVADTNWRRIDAGSAY